MPDLELKLKQASAVLGVAPKELQNLVQFGVVKPRLRRQVFWFDREGLLRAKVALYLKESLGASTQMLARFTETLFEQSSFSRKRATVTLLSRPRSGAEPLQIRVPFGSLAREIKERWPLAENARDLPRGRKRSGWADEFLANMRAASGDLRGASDEEILRSLELERRRKRAAPEVSVLGEESKKAVARRR
jgi:hypothetical protein